VLGDRDRRHLQPDSLIEDLVDPARAVEQRELGVEVEVNELSHDLGTRSPQSAQSYLVFAGLAAFAFHPYSHSIVDGGFDEMS
jgi:hypothetical protein